MDGGSGTLAIFDSSVFGKDLDQKPPGLSFKGQRCSAKLPQDG